MKSIYNWRDGTVADIESDGLLKEATKFHILSFHMINDKVGSIDGDDHSRLKAFFKYHLDNNIPVVGHNFIGFDIPLVEKLLGIDLSELMVVDTLAISWYLNVGRKMHGLDSFLDDYGIAKVKVADDQWAFVPNTVEEEVEHKRLMKLRCDDDVKINKALWLDFIDRLVDMYTRVKSQVDARNVMGTRMSPDEEMYIDQYINNSTVDEYIDRILTFLMFKSDTIRLREKTRWEVDVAHLELKQREFSKDIEDAKSVLETVMPPVPKYSKKKFPKNPHLKPKKMVKKKRETEEEFLERQDVENSKPKKLSSSGISWNTAIDNIDKIDDLGNPITKTIEGVANEVMVLAKYDDPNAGSSAQIKTWLFSHGWVPQTFEYKKDETLMQIWVDSGFKKHLKPKPRKIPQVSKVGDKGKELCQSVVDLSDKVPEVMHYDKYTTIKHRLDMVNSFIKHLEDGKFLKASAHGFTNTLRDKHRAPLANLPGIDKLYGEDIRGSLIAGEGKILEGSDLSSLEDRSKHHFMLPHDPEYVKTMMSDDYDPHILMALSANLITQDEFDRFMSGDKTPNAKKQRKAGKTTNYASVYNAGGDTVARAAGVPNKVGKQLVDGYWKLNWSVKAVAEEQCTVTCCKGLHWLINPINGFAYNLRKEQDRFSTLCQGTGSFFFDMWVDNILQGMDVDPDMERNLCGEFHDEFISRFEDTPEIRERMTRITHDAIDKVNVTYKLRRKLGCDVQWGTNYAQIH